jgi:NAD dependent epimerase/dehydratase family.
MKPILLTGATGFIGTNTLREVVKYNKVYVIVRTIPSQKIFYRKNIKLIHYKNYEQLNEKLKKIKIHTVVHCATHYVRHHTYSDIRKLLESNILLGNIILENIKSMKVKKFINFSTIWQDKNNTNGKFINLYAAYKKGFSEIFNYYKKLFNNIYFYEVLISDTFGFNDKRKKLAVVLNKNFRQNKTTKIISNNLYINLLNIKDINSAVNKILETKIKPDQYVLKNDKDFKISDIINKLNIQNVKKIKIKWLSKKIIKNKVTKYSKIKTWKPKESNISDVVNYITSIKS